MRLLVFGLGYSARAVVERLRPRLEKAWGTTRSPEKLDEIRSLGVLPILFDGTRPPDRPPEVESLPPQGEGIGRALAEATHVLISIAPGPGGDPVLAHFRNDLAGLKPRALIYLSTVGVYGDHGGDWVDETSECRPVSGRSRERLEAEAGWRRFAGETGVPAAIIRLAGIYGPQRGPFEKIRRGTARRIVKPGQVFNRIHVEDIAAIVEAAFDRRADGVFNGVDDEPTPPEDVLAYAAELLGAPPPPLVAVEDVNLSTMARSFYGESKRIRNEKIKRELGVILAYPTYREGLRAIMAAEGRHEPGV